MRNWDRPAEEYMEQYRARGLAEDTVSNVRRELDRLRCWLMAGMRIRRMRDALPPDERVMAAKVTDADLRIAIGRP